MLRGESLAAVRGDRKLFTDLSFQLSPGELLYVSGPNGSGKTTLLRMLCGLVLPAGGRVLWRGEDIHDLGDLFRAELAYSGHHYAIKDDLNGLENLRVACCLAGTAASDDQLLAALRRMGVEQTDLPAKLLSQGQKRRLDLSRLLLSPAQLWVLDEPFNALDNAAVDLFRGVIRTALERGGMVVLTTHQQVEIDAATVKQVRMGP